LWPLGARLIASLSTRAIRAGTISTMPRWMREMSGLHQRRTTDLAIRPLLWTAFHVVHLSARLQLALLQLLSPMTVPVAAPVLLGVPPVKPEIVSPALARARYGYDKPSEAHEGLRARQAERVFGEGASPSDEGLVESEPILGLRS
jgi:hypothetical protein